MLTQKIALCWYYTTKGCHFMLTGLSYNHDMLFWALPRSIFLSFNFSEEETVQKEQVTFYKEATKLRAQDLWFLVPVTNVSKCMDSQNCSVFC